MSIAGHWRGSKRPPRNANLTIDEHNRAAFDLVAESIRADAPLVLYGTAGTGKTTLMREIDAATRAAEPEIPLFDRRSYQTWLDEPNWWTTVAEFCEDVRAGWKLKFDRDENQELYLPMGIAKRVKRLFLDDLGVEGESDVNLESIITLLTARHAESLPTWITTNLSPSALHKRYGERIISRLKELTVFVPVGGADRRVARTATALRALPNAREEAPMLRVVP